MLHLDCQLPAFICLGVQKAATTWLYKVLQEHPDVQMPLEKELRFFHPWDGNKSWRSYLSKFKVGSISGEISPDYLISSAAAKQIKFRLPDVKLFVILRNPVDRAISQYRMDLRANLLSSDVSFLEHFDADRMFLASRGLYAKQITSYLEHFELDKNLKIFFYDDIVTNSKLFFQQICEYLQIKSVFPSVLFKKFNVGAADIAITLEDVQHLNKFYLHPNQELHNIIGRELQWGITGLMNYKCGQMNLTL